MAGKTRNQKIPWDDIKKEYVEGSVDSTGKRYYPSQPELCEKYRVASSSIGTRASKEQWAVERQIFTSKLEEVTREKTIETISNESSSFDLKCFNVASRLLDVCEAKADRAHEGCDVDDMKKVAETMKTLQVVGRMALGLPTDISKTSGSLSVNAKDLTRMDEDG